MHNKKIHSYILLAMQIIAHLSIIPMFLYAGIQEYLISFIVYFFTGCIGVSITLHRYLSHKSFKTKDIFIKFGTLCASLGMIGSPLAWVAVHREHHHYSDTEKDPHSPSFKKFYKVQWLSMFETVNIRYIKDLFKDDFQVWVHNYYYLINIVYVSILFLIDPFAVVYAWLFPGFILWNMGSLVNTLNHLYGSRPYKTKEKSTNHWLTGIFVFGEGWHNNHHNNPKNPRFGEKWYEIDLGYYIIKLFRKSDV